MHRITIIAVMLAAFATSAVAQVHVDTDNRVRQPAAAPKAGGPPPKGLTYEKIEWAKDPKAGAGKAQGIQSPRDAASGLPTGKR